MIKIISPDQFKTFPWKNGQGQTTELAINPGGSVLDFNWRLSIANVVTDGAFSDFSGYDRQLILLSGNGISLTHDKKRTDKLIQPLSVAKFDGGDHTVGTLLDGPIKDFNVMTQQGCYKAKVKIYTKQQTIVSSLADLNFVYATIQSIKIQFKQQQVDLPQSHLLQITDTTEDQIQVCGKGFIVISLQPLT